MTTRERLASKRALLPLALMAAVFILPTYRACSDDPLQSPAHFALGDLGSALWIAPSFLVAGLLAFLTARALRKKEVDLTTRRLGLMGLGALGLSALGTALVSLWPMDGMHWVHLAALLGVLTGAGLLVRRARGRPGWQIWEHLLGAFGLTAAVSGPAVFLGAELFFGSRTALGPGAYVYLGSLAALLALTFGAVLRAGRR